MKEKELMRLMNDQLDGVATPEDSDRLKRHLAESAEARIKFRELGDVFTSLNRVEMVDPPSNLTQDVIRSIGVRAVSAPARSGWLELIGDAFRKRPALRYAYSFAAGAGVAAMLFALVTGGALTRSQRADDPFVGTMLPTSSLAGFQRVDGREYRLQRGSVIIESLASSDGLVARVEASGPVGTEIEISYDPTVLTASALRQRHSGGNEVSLGQGQLQIRINDNGVNQYLLYLARLRPTGSLIRVVVHSAAEEFQGELQTGASRFGS
jgi:hypothetical protein